MTMNLMLHPYHHHRHFKEMSRLGYHLTFFKCLCHFIVVLIITFWDLILQFAHFRLHII